MAGGSLLSSNWSLLRAVKVRRFDPMHANIRWLRDFTWKPAEAREPKSTPISSTPTSVTELPEAEHLFAKGTISEVINVGYILRADGHYFLDDAREGVDFEFTE